MTCSSVTGVTFLNSYHIVASFYSLSCCFLTPVVSPLVMSHRSLWATNRHDRCGPWKSRQLDNFPERYAAGQLSLSDLQDLHLAKAINGLALTAQHTDLRTSTHYAFIMKKYLRYWHRDWTAKYYYDLVSPSNHMPNQNSSNVIIGYLQSLVRRHWHHLLHDHPRDVSWHPHIPVRQGQHSPSSPSSVS